MKLYIKREKILLEKKEPFLDLFGAIKMNT